MPLTFKWDRRYAKSDNSGWVAYLTGKIGYDKTAERARRRNETKKLREREKRGQLVMEIADDLVSPEKEQP